VEGNSQVSDSTRRAGHAARGISFAIVASGLILLGTVAGVSAAQRTSTSTSPAAANLAPFSDGALLIRPNSNVMDLHRQAWDHITVSANGKRLVVYFWMGPRACNGLGKVDVTRDDGRLNIQLWTGIPPHRIGFVCPEYAQLYKTVIYLQRPIIRGAF
jgi:hypothetical protein